MSPWTDLALTGDSVIARAEDDPFLTKAALANAAKAYLVTHQAEDPDASPPNGSLAGLPPIQAHVGTFEMLLDDARRYVARASEAKVDAVLHVWEGMPHVFPSSIGHLDAAEKALTLMGSFLMDQIGNYPPVPADDPSQAHARACR
jgi:acetyl esterase/lipase